MAHHRSLAYHPTARTYSGADDRDYSPPDDDSKSGRGEKKPRKRNSVACARCRKRKIKCTGDLHDGNGCEACQTAGTNPTSCFYLRVNSHQLGEFAPQSAPEPEWPYSAPASTAYSSSAPRITSDPSQYALANGTMLAPSTAAPYSVQATSRAQPLNDMASGSYAPTAQLRPYVPVGYQTGMDSVHPQYGSQPSRQGIPLQMSQPLTVSYSAAELSQHWTPMSTTTRPLPSNYALDAEASSNYQSSAFSYQPTSGVSYSTGPTEASSVFPGLSPLASSLPYNGTNRTLPNPVSVQSSLHNSSGSTHESNAGLGPFQQHLDTTNESWDLAVGTSRSSVSSATQDPISTSGPASSTSSSSPSDSHGVPNNAYDNLAYSSHVGSDVSASSITSGGVPRRISNEDGFQTMASGISSNHSGRNQLSNLNSPFNIQGMHAGFGMHGSSVTPMASTGSLVSNHGPPSIHHPQPHYSATHDMRPIIRSSFNPKSQDSRRPLNSNTRGPKSQGLP